MNGTVGQMNVGIVPTHLHVDIWITVLLRLARRLHIKHTYTHTTSTHDKYTIKQTCKCLLFVLAMCIWADDMAPTLSLCHHIVSASRQITCSIECKKDSIGAITEGIQQDIQAGMTSPTKSLSFHSLRNCKLGSTKIF